MKQFIAAALLVTALSSPAFAHTNLKASIPAEGSTVEAAPAAFVLTFTEPSRLTALTLQKDGGPEQKIADLPAAAAVEASVAAPRLENGRYTLTYRVIGSDGHVMNGKVSFTVGGKAAPGATTGQGDHTDHKTHSGR